MTGTLHYLHKVISFVTLAAWHMDKTQNTMAHIHADRRWVVLLYYYSIVYVSSKEMSFMVITG